ncbi:hypothetical protein HS088_TW06G00795 [Tripterygium wilfordii]|uniref:Uncharacterized protein n=1 Tax=Tripterygium wilfordii TaxID=458696 RepID=A0A7J7DK54_TRIWF|nr:hypothetical protein HS088_TW06G00795 [Tripterygium wilfordii]
MAISNNKNGLSKKLKWRSRRGRRGLCRRGMAMRMKVKKLQKLIPGGHGLEANRLLLRTADYIMHLRI